MKTFWNVIFISLLTLGLPAGAAEKGADVAPNTQNTRVAGHYGVSQTDVQQILPTLRRVLSVADSLSTNHELKRIAVLGTTSADGSVQINQRVSSGRVANAAAWLRKNGNFPASIVTQDVYIGDWKDVKQIMSDPSFAYKDAPYYQPVMTVLNKGLSRANTQAQLKALQGGKAWTWLDTYVLPRQRSTIFDIYSTLREEPIHITTPDLTPQPEPAPEPEPVPEPEPEPVPEPEPEPVIEEPVVEEVVEVIPAPEPEWMRHLYLKTNVPAWGLLWINAAVEVDLAEHFTAQLPIYYSGFNYFTGHRKYRTFTIQPEVRWFPRADNMGFFAGAHFGLGWYNVAFEGQYRYQDHNRRTPAIGGGLAVGYRCHISRNHRWQLEVSAGYGIYRLDYDLFENKHDGLLVGRRQRTFYGCDQAAVTISYRFDLNKKKGGIQ